MRLTEKICVIPNNDIVNPEDIFSSSLNILFADDLRNEHGDPGAVVVYKSNDFGDITLQLADPQNENDRMLFAHYLWNASIWAAECIQGVVQDAAKRTWDARGESVLELGAGLGLIGIVSTLCGASRVVLSDHPTPTVLSNITSNVMSNIPSTLQSRVTITGHKWGDLSDPFSLSSATSFTRIFAADCLWMPGEHQNLAQSMQHFLSRKPHARVFVVAGFHTGRAKLAPFFDVVVEEGFDVESVKEVDVLEGREREWAKERDGGRENVTERKRWLVVAVLKLRRAEELAPN